mgnify:CR=1 FL=1
MNEADYYEILGVDNDATQEEIKNAYKVLAKRYHPDKNNGKDEMFKKIAEANSILSDPEKREKYDEILISGGNIDDLDNGRTSTNTNDKFFSSMGSFNDIFNQPFFRQNSAASFSQQYSGPNNNFGRSRESHRVSNTSETINVSDMFGLENIPNIPGLPNIAEILRMAGIGNLANLTKGVPTSQSKSYTQSFSNNGNSKNYSSNRGKTIYAKNEDDLDDIDSSDSMFSSVSSDTEDSIKPKNPPKKSTVKSATKPKAPKKTTTKTIKKTVKKPTKKQSINSTNGIAKAPRKPRKSKTEVVNN